MRTPLLFLATLLAAPATVGTAFAGDGHFTLPPGSPANNTVAGGFTGNNNKAPDGCDANRLTAWFKDWRQRAREGYVRGIVAYIPSLAPGANCIKSPEALDVRYIPQGDYFVASCLAQTKGVLTHFFEMDIDVPVDKNCLGDDRIVQYVKGNQCKMPGGNQQFLDQVMKPCAVTPPNSPVVRRKAATAIDPNYFARLLNDRPELKEIVDENTRKVKVGGSPGSGGGGGCDNPFLCDNPGVNGESRDVK